LRPLIDRRAGNGLAPDADWHKNGISLSVLSALTYVARDTRHRCPSHVCDSRTLTMPEPPALAFGCSYSVLKERRRARFQRKEVPALSGETPQKFPVSPHTPSPAETAGERFEAARPFEAELYHTTWVRAVKHRPHTLPAAHPTA